MKKGLDVIIELLARAWKNSCIPCMLGLLIVLALIWLVQYWLFRAVDPPPGPLPTVPAEIVPAEPEE